MNIFIILLLTLLDGCATNTPELRETINQPSLIGNKIIKGVTTKEEILKLFGRKPDPPILYKGSLQLSKDEVERQYYEKWTYICTEESFKSRIAYFFGGDILLKLKDAVGINSKDYKGYCISIYFDENGIAQDYRINWTVGEESRLTEKKK